MEHAKEAIQDFHRQNPEAARRMVISLRKIGIPIEIVEGDFGTKSWLRKGYYQESTDLETTDGNLSDESTDLSIGSPVISNNRTIGSPG